MLYTIFHIISYCTLQFHLHISALLPRSIGYTCFIILNHIQWSKQLAKRAVTLIEHSHQSNHETNLTISDFHSLALCTERDDGLPDKSTLNRSMSKREYIFSTLQRAERVMNKHNTVFKFVSLVRRVNNNNNN